MGFSEKPPPTERPPRGPEYIIENFNFSKRQRILFSFIGHKYDYQGGNYNEQIFIQYEVIIGSTADGFIDNEHVTLDVGYIDSGYIDIEGDKSIYIHGSFTFVRIGLDLNIFVNINPLLENEFTYEIIDTQMIPTPSSEPIFEGRIEGGK